MRILKRAALLGLPLVAVVALMATVSKQSAADGAQDPEAFPTETHFLLPDPGGERVAYGAVTDEVLDQPIAYSHKLHAGELKIECEYCHSYARRSPHAGVPPTQACVGCHGQFISTEGRPELEKIKEFWANGEGEAIPWNKVHDLPDFVYFSHKRHIQGGLACQECHGQVQDDMTVAYRVNTLQMGWCLNCHATHPSVDANYGASAELRRAELKDCYTCHK